VENIWNIWTHRNNAIFRNLKFNALEVFTSIQMKIVGMEANAKLYLMYPHED